MKLPADEGLVASMTQLSNLDAGADLAFRPLSIIDLRVSGRVFLTPAKTPQGGAA